MICLRGTRRINVTSRRYAEKRRGISKPSDRNSLVGICQYFKLIRRIRRIYSHFAVSGNCHAFQRRVCIHGSRVKIHFGTVFGACPSFSSSDFHAGPFFKKIAVEPPSFKAGENLIGRRGRRGIDRTAGMAPVNK